MENLSGHGSALPNNMKCAQVNEASKEILAKNGLITTMSRSRR